MSGGRGRAEGHRLDGHPGGLNGPDPRVNGGEEGPRGAAGYVATGSAVVGSSSVASVKITMYPSGSSTANSRQPYE